MKITAAIAATSLALVTSPLHANETASHSRAIAEPSAEAEREALALALKEFQAIERLIAEAEARRPDGARVYFDYGALRTELLQVKFGIRQYLDERRPQPRSFEPLEATYVGVNPAE